ncbi:hypothetical protein GD605_02875 [Desulfolutivibrio sulfoxidireducens]|nr:hypothetical protein GD605_02875 [Desulfolutivibrio sulfoxidireducens]
MRIICPECGFSRNVPDDKVPASSAVATCPKCRHRFRFRDPADGGEGGGWDREPPVPEPRLPGEGEDGYPAPPAFDASGGTPGPARRGRMASPQGHWPEPDAAAFRPPESRPTAGAARVFPPPSAHWEPAESAESEDSPGQPPADVSAPDGPPEAKHTPDRLSVDVRDAGSPRRSTRPEKEPGREQNGVRDIWARLQAMDDEDEPRPVPPRPAAPRQIVADRDAAGSEAPRPPRQTASQTPPGTPREAARVADGPPVGERSSPPTPGSVDADGPDIPPRDVSGRETTSGTSARAVPPDETAAPEEPDAGLARPGSQGEVPWERLDVYGFFPGLLLTLKRILFQPVEFFESMPPGRGKGKAMVFNLVLSEFLLAIDFFWGLLGVRAKIADTGQTDALAAMAGLPGIGFLILLIMVPVFMVAGIYLDAGLTHLLLVLLRGNGKGFDETFRAMCYSAAPTVLSAVPVAGQILSPVLLIWYMTLQAIGLKKIHGAAYSQALAVVLIKWSLYLFLLLGVLNRLSSGV